MKMKFSVWLKVILMVTGLALLSGCASGGVRYHSVAYWQSDPLAAIDQSAFPPNPVRRSSTEIRSLGGDYSYSHNQGTDNYAYKSWDPYSGPRQDMRQSTYNNTYESLQRRPYGYGAWVPPTANIPLLESPVPQKATPKSAVKPKAKAAPKADDCLEGTIKMVPIQKGTSGIPTVEP